MIDVDDRIARTGAVEGAGIVSGAKDYADAVTRPQADSGEVAATGAGLGLDMLGAAMNPLGALAEAGVGYLIEHIAFLREPLDRLCGEPLEIEDRARAWHTLSSVLEQQGAALSASVGQDLAGWQGDAAQAYRSAAGRTGGALTSLAGDAAGVSDAVLRSGAMVGLERSLIRDLIASWLAQVIAWIGAAILSAGLALTVAIPSTVAEAARMALRFADTIEELVRVLDEVGEAVTALSKNMDRVAREARGVGEAGGTSAAQLAPTGSGAVATPLFEATTDTLVEDGKQQAKVRERRTQFSQPPPPAG